MNSHVSMAVQAFREVERAKLLLDKKEQALLVSVHVMATNCDPEDRAEYVRLTDEVLAEFEGKREKAGLS
jgi:hypothetical protein